MATSSYTTDPIPLMEEPETVHDIIELIRTLAFPQLVVTIESDNATEVYERIIELNDQLRSFCGVKIPLPEVCPTCGTRQ